MYVVLRVDSAPAYVHGHLEDLNDVGTLGPGRFAIYSQGTLNTLGAPKQFTYLKTVTVAVTTKVTNVPLP